jgi:hypothetical protein
MGITRSQYIQGNSANGTVLPLVQGVTAGFGVSIDTAGALSVTPAVLPQPTIINLGALEPINGTNVIFTLVEYNTTTPVTLTSTTNLVIFLGGVPQLPGFSYNVVGNQVTFVSAPPSGTTFLGMTVIAV